MTSNKKLVAQAVGGKTARACDSCIKKRARWYCAADDAFLCESCDSSVHSANQLASRHERVLLNTASSLKPPYKNDRTSTVPENSAAAPSWHRGVTRKARTPRHGKSVNGQKSQAVRNRFPQVPEVGADDNNSYEENEEDQQLLYRVPIFEPVAAELCTSASANEEAGPDTCVSDFGNQLKPISSSPNNFKRHDGFLLPTDMDLSEFAADVDSLLGRGLDDDECFGMEGLGLTDCKEKDELKCKVEIEDDEQEEEEGFIMDQGVNNFKGETSENIEMMREPFELNFEDYDDTPGWCGEQVDDKLGVRIDSTCSGNHHEEVEEDRKSMKKRNIFLRLDYEAVITAWDGSPWTSGGRPNFDFESLSDCMLRGYGGEVHYAYGDMSRLGLHPAMADGGREARVSRYREKRRTRLFSKKIRYEVRKLNAEKRPRMKGRFVKRSSFAGSANLPIHSK